MNIRVIIVILSGVLGIGRCVFAQKAPFSVAENLFNQKNTNTLDLDYPEGIETVTVFAPTDDTDKFSNGVVITSFKGALYCMWQSSAKDEDAEDTWVAYARSEDGGITWSEPMVLAETMEDGYRSSGGWLATEDTLVAFINEWPKNISPRGGYTKYVKSDDGLHWTSLADVKMADGSPMAAIFEQDPHVVKSGRVVNAAHFQPGLHVCPIYTDDPLGITGWMKADFKYSGSGDQSRELEPSLYQKLDGNIVMIFRDQNSTFYKIAAESADDGATWSDAIMTNMPDARTKQSAGNLPDGTSYFVGNPVSNKTRIPLVITLSKDGNFFDTAFLLREGGVTMPELRYSGSAKRAGYHYPKSMIAGQHLYVAYALNKEDVQYTRIPLASISLDPNGVSKIKDGELSIDMSGRMLSVSGLDDTAVIYVYNLDGSLAHTCQINSGYATVDLGYMKPGVAIMKMETGGKTEIHKIIIK